MGAGAALYAAPAWCGYSPCVFACMDAPCRRSSGLQGPGLALCSNDFYAKAALDYDICMKHSSGWKDRCEYTCKCVPGCTAEKCGHLLAPSAQHSVCAAASEPDCQQCCEYRYYGAAYMCD